MGCEARQQGGERGLLRELGLSVGTLGPRRCSGLDEPLPFEQAAG
jgi:hypothetical protein